MGAHRKPRRYVEQKIDEPLSVDADALAPDLHVVLEQPDEPAHLFLFDLACDQAAEQRCKLLLLALLVARRAIVARSGRISHRTQSIRGKNMGILDGKKLLITGVLTDDSLAFAAAKRAQEEGAE